MKQTEIGQIPEDWEIAGLQDNITLKARIGWQGLTTAEYRENGDYYLITGTDFKNGYIDWKNCVFVDKIRYDQDRNIQVNEKDILVTKDGTIGKVAYIDSISKSTTLNSGIFVLRVLNEKMDSRFIYYILMSFYFENFLKQITAGSTITHLYQKDFVHFNFIVPPLPEQQAIAEVLSDTDHWITSLEDLIAKKQLIKQGAMQKLLTPKDDWEVKKLGEICEIIKGKGLSKNDLKTDGKYQCILYGELFTNYNEVIKDIKSSTDRDESVVSKNGDILFPGSTTTAGIDLAKSSTILKGNVLLGGDIIIVRKLNYNYSPIFLTYFLNVIKKYEIARKTKGITIHHLYASDLIDIIVSFPALPEQERIATILSDMDAEIETLEQKLAKAKQIKQGLMQELLTGRIRLVQSKSTIGVKPATKHNEHFNDAVLIGVMASCFASEQFPLTRFKYTKVSYLLKRYKDEQTTGYLKKAAGPYNPQTRYGGAEKIAIERKYITVKKSIYKGNVYEGFLQSENNEEALHYFRDWYGEDTLEWIKQFKFETNDNLELLATVDMAIQDLKEENKEINLLSIKKLIRENEEWRNKLNRSAFSDKNIEEAIKKINTLYK